MLLGDDCVIPPESILKPGEDSIWHVWPRNDFKIHMLHSSCWCRPTLDDSGVMIHNSLDGREDYESGKRKPC